MTTLQILFENICARKKQYKESTEYLNNFDFRNILLSHKPPLQVVVWKSPVRATACSPLKGDVTSLLLALL